MLAQLDLFSTTSIAPSAAPTIELPTACRCGATTTTVGSSCGPHAARLCCAGCGSFRAWLSATAFRRLGGAA